MSKFLQVLGRNNIRNIKHFETALFSFDASHFLYEDDSFLFVLSAIIKLTSFIWEESFLPIFSTDLLVLSNSL